MSEHIFSSYEFWEPFLLTLKLALITTIFLFIIGVPLAYYLVFSRNRFISIIEALVAMPLVLPPSVLGFYFLLAFSQDGFLGGVWKELFGHQLAFHFEGLVIGSIVFSLPFMVHPILAGLKGVDTNQIEASYTMGKSRLATLLKVILPTIKPSLIAGGVISFAHTVGEFGVVLMIGGNIDGETKVVSIAIYDQVETLNYIVAHAYSLILFIFSFAVLWFVYLKTNKHRLGGL
ncbi:molybdate ABC transporter permease subunit [Sulfurimonas sp.]|uniref:molybdate ABC transporter permease subunit n=1 Tax=Sulfurimonas sp. TaxID=2022749 RepID=UPI0025F47C3A|nr:molybdate ABC transporter permease subunit [Sulfurimonas sp.]